mgnify:CR=1 FL=1
MLSMSLILISLLKCNSFIIPVNKNNNFLIRMFEREDFIRKDIIIKDEEKLKEIDEEKLLLNQTLIEINNSVIRSGRSLDQDGKTNIWSIEPTMIVDETKQKDLFKLLGLFISAILITFQFFLLIKSNFT